MGRTVFGMKVDEHLYNKYNFDEKTGMTRLYMVNGKEMSLFATEFYATSTVYAEESPEMAEAARRIMEKVQREIADYYAVKGGRKENMAMKHDTFDGYLRDLQEIHAKVAPERIQLKEKWDQAQKRWEEDQKEFKGDERYLAREKVRYLDAQEEYKVSVKELQERTLEEIRAVQAEYERHVTDFYSADGNRLDDAAVRLLNSGIKLTDSELDRMVDQNKGNPTMLRLISDHCDRHEIGNQSVRVYGSLARKGGEDEREAFRTIAKMVEKAVSTDEVTAEVWSGSDSHFKRLSDQQISVMRSFWVRPMAPETADR